MMKVKLSIVWVIVLIVLTACGGDQNAAGTNQAGDASKPPAKVEPFEMLVYAAGVSPEEFDSRFRTVLQKKFPHITFKYQTNTKGNSISELVSSGVVPDLIRIDIPTLKSGYLDLQLGYDLNEMIDKHKYDLKRFNPPFVQEIIDAGGTGAIYGLPVPPFFPTVLYYNKDLFDKFGVPYPKDGMNWDDIYTMSRVFNRKDDGITYRGFSANLNSALRDNVFSLPILDPEADKLADSEKWKQLFNNFKRFYDPTLNPIENTMSLENVAFSKGNVAMQLNQHNIYLNIPPEVNWDIVAPPTLEGAPKKMGQRGPAYWAITKQSKHKEEAFRVIVEMLSDEVQKEDAKKGIPTTLVDSTVWNELGKGHAVYGTKNMKALQVYTPTSPTPKRKPGLVTVNYSTQDSIIHSEFIRFAKNETDVNTALRTVDERLKKLLEEERNK